MKKKKDSAVLVDDIDKKKRQLELQHNKTSRSQRIFESIPDGVICADSDRRIIMTNPGMEKLFGYKDVELLGKRTEFLYDSREDFEIHGLGWPVANAEREKISFEANFCKKDGTIFTAEVVGTHVKDQNGEIIFYIKLVRDITERKKLENSLRQLELKFRTVADFTYDWECWIKEDGSYHYISPSCERISGYSPSQFMENPSLLNEIIHPEDKDLWHSHRDEAKTRTTSSEIQFRIVRKDGEIRWIEHACQPVIDENGKESGFRSSNRDVTERKNSEIQLRNALLEIENYKEQLEAESAYLQEEIKLIRNYDNIIGSSNALQYILFKIEQIANTDTLVLLLGETGTGKELFARAIHNTSPQRSRPLVTINCAALPANLIESELFGHERGSFTSAHARQIGRFELADNGTIFLDEIGEIPLELQAKLLRVLQEGEFERLGGARTIKVNVRVIAATNRDLEEDVRKGLFRTDLWYRLNVFPITAPPLRERIDDIPQLVKFFTERFSKKQGKKITTISADVMKRLEKYSWPGNVRELENVIERAVINSNGSKMNLLDQFKETKKEVIENFQTLGDMERDYIIKVLEKTNWKVSGRDSASEILGLQRGTLRAKMEKYKIRRS